MAKVLHGEILGPELTPEEEAVRAKQVRSKFWKTFRKAARFVPFSEELVAAYYCALDSKTPHRVRAMLLGALAYFVLPIDAIPDILAGIGYSDDITVLIGVIALVRAHIKPEHREAARQALREEAGA